MQLSSGPEVSGLPCGPGERTIIHSSHPISIQPISKCSEAELEKQLADLPIARDHLQDHAKSILTWVEVGNS